MARRSVGLKECSVTPVSLNGSMDAVSRDEVLITATELARRLDARETLEEFILVVQVIDQREEFRRVAAEVKAYE